MARRRPSGPIYPEVVEVLEKKRDRAASWAERIGSCWAKSVAGIIQTGMLLQEAKRALAHGEWGRSWRPSGAMAELLPFGQDYADMLMRIAESPLLANSDNCRKLPATVSTLYELALLDDDVLAAALERGEVTPEMTRKDAARLAGTSGLEPSPWTELNAMARCRDFANRELKRGAPMPEAVAELLKRVALEILTPMPEAERERLWREAELLAVEEEMGIVDLDDRTAVEQHIIDAGGMRPTTDYGELPFRVLNKAGRGIDELADDLAKAQGGAPRIIERHVIHTLTHPPTRKGQTKASRRAIKKKIEAVLDGRAVGV